MTAAMHLLRRRLGAWRRETRGAAAAEFAMVVLFLILPLINIVDFGVYAYSRMQVENAAQMGAQTIWSSCNNLTKRTPAAIGSNGSCAASTSPTVTTWVQQTSLGTPRDRDGRHRALLLHHHRGDAAVRDGHRWRGQPHQRASATGEPAKCAVSATLTNPSDTGATPGDYISLGVTYTYPPLFSAASIVSALLRWGTKTVYTRLG